MCFFNKQIKKYKKLTLGVWTSSAFGSKNKEDYLINLSIYTKNI